MSNILLNGTQTKIDLASLLGDISATKVSEFSATKDDDISDTNISATKDSKFSDTKVSSTKYMNQYKREHYDTIRFDVPKGTKVLLQEEANKRGISLTEMIKQSIKSYLELN